ncbi:MAG: LUD domain-containing protein, partial [Halioglobus sp.]|nr:LUD domain-containing protein [Halioglobus sp.]
MEQRSDRFLDNAAEALADTPRAERRDAMALFAPLMRDAGVATFKEFEPTREHVKRVRRHALDNLAHYLAQYEENAARNGNTVHFARDEAEFNSIVLDICQRHDAQRVVKGKSMVTEETGLTGHLEQGGLHVVE